MNIYLTDNNIGTKDEGIFNRMEVSALFPYGNKTIAQLCKDNRNLLIFPQSIEDTKDKINDAVIYSIDNTENSDTIRLTTGNLVGFIGIKNIMMKIQSRFDEGREDYLLHYLLSKVLSFNLFDLNHHSDEEEVFDFLLILFPKFLRSALCQGIYREYHQKEYNDSRVKGTIQVSQFIKKDIPFTGRIAYTARNYSYDNSMTELIRHTIEYMKTKESGRHILGMNNDIVNDVKSIIEVTPSYELHERLHVIHENIRPKIHPYYTQYQPLQSLCLQILRKENIKYGNDVNEICGILFDVAWLWEEYLYNSILRYCNFKHPQNKDGKDAIYLFENQSDRNIPSGSRYKRYPDYFKPGFILDAKYKRLAKGTIDRDDMHQIISYMHVEKAQIGGFIYPFAGDNVGVKENVGLIGTLRGCGGKVYKIGIPIPSYCKSFSEFTRKMNETEESLKRLILNVSRH